MKKININKLCENIDIFDLYIYKSEIFRPFIDCYLKSNKKSKYKLFNAYIFQYHRLAAFFKERDYVPKNIFLENGLPNLKLKAVRDSFIANNVVYFIGYTAELNALFIRMDYFKDKKTGEQCYDFAGFMQESSNVDYDYLTSDRKKLNFKLKNVTHTFIARTEYNFETHKYDDSPIYALSKKTKTYVDSLIN